MIKAIIPNYTYDDVRQAYRCVFRNTIYFFAAFIAVAFVAMVIGMVILFNSGQDILFGVPFIIFIGCVLIEFYFLVGVPSEAFRKMKKSFKCCGGASVCCEFDENEVRLSRNGGGINTLRSVEYSILSVNESDDLFLLICKKNINVIPKRCIIEGSPEELGNLLKAKLGEKYRSKLRRVC